jgi:hypothetical protein
MIVGTVTQANEENKGLGWSVSVRMPEPERVSFPLRAVVAAVIGCALATA